MKTTVKTYPTNIELFTEESSFNLDIDFQDSAFFDDATEAKTWLEDNLPQEVMECENIEEVMDACITALDRYTA